MRHTVEQVVNDIRGAHVNTVQAVLFAGYAMKYIGSGMFRNVYKIIGANLVVKIPIGAKGRRHALGEWEAYNRVLKSKLKYLPLKAHMPTIHGFNRRTGVMVMELYRPSGKRDRKAIIKIGDVARVCCGKYCDLHVDNVFKDQFGEYRIIDLGYLSHKIKPKPRRKRTELVYWDDCTGS